MECFDDPAKAEKQLENEKKERNDVTKYEKKVHDDHLECPKALKRPQSSIKGGTI